jgi:hypothetical protein
VEKTGGRRLESSVRYEQFRLAAVRAVLVVFIAYAGMPSGTQFLVPG